MKPLVTKHLMKYFRFLALTSVLFAGYLALIATEAQGRIARTLKLTKQDITDLVHIEQHLNKNETVRARFLQVSSDGSYAEGTINIQRPGKMRVEYDPPNPNMIISDGINIFYIDRELDQATPMLLSFTPAEIILRKNISFSADEILITGFNRSPGVIEVSVVRAKNPLEGQIKLVFSDVPLELRKWVVTDGQGIKTTVSLLGPEFGMKLNPNLFLFEMPDPFKGNN